MTTESPGIIPFVVEQHAEDAAFLHGARTMLARSGHAKLKELAAFDARLAAQLDALGIAGEAAWPICDATLESPSAGAAFMGAVRAIEDQHETRLSRLLSLAEALPQVRCGLSSAFGWVSQSRLQGTALALLRHQYPFRRLVGLTACGMHRVDCGLTAGPWVQDTEPEVRARALRSVGEIGLDRLAPALAAAQQDEEPECRFWAVWSGALLGYSRGVLPTLVEVARAAGSHQERAFRLALLCLDRVGAHTFLTDLAHEPSELRRIIQGSGLIGDPSYVPWLFEKMAIAATARTAAESFSLIAGLDIAAAGMQADRPEDFESGPNDNPDDDNVDMDPDEGLPWPDVQKIEAWWMQNRDRFTPGRRYFMGQPVTKEHCIHVLKHGYQRQRILAAQYLCLLEPGTPLFNTSAPAWRQQRLLARM